ncbi:hypothetical protein RP20_CCG012712 [Aedes albopictus]|nr:hypothetical protein RP20_CCG012712 [Aedes albopictus]
MLAKCQRSPSKRIFSIRSANLKVNNVTLQAKHAWQVVLPLLKTTGTVPKCCAVTAVVATQSKKFARVKRRVLVVVVVVVRAVERDPLLAETRIIAAC